MTGDANLLTVIAQEVKEILAEAEAGHDWRHIQRVYQNAELIAKDEHPIDLEVVRLAALLHDIADPKFHDGNEEIGPQTASAIMAKHGCHPAIIEHVVNIIRHMSFKNSIEGQQWTSKEMEIVQDADRLDAIGAVGIARAFNYGGYKNRLFFDPDIPPMTKMSKEQYKTGSSPTINHFYEKLLKLKDLMNTSKGKKLAQERHNFMIAYLDQFYCEVGAVPSWHLPKRDIKKT